MSFLRSFAALSVLWVTCSCATLTLPAAAPVGGPAAASMPDAPAVVLLDEATLSFRAERRASGGARWVAVLDHHRIIKILRPEGLRQARVALPMDGASRVGRIVARAVGPKGRTRDADADDARVVPRPAAGEQAPELRCLIMEVPGVEVGGAVEYRYERTYSDPYAVPPWLFGGPLPVQRATFGIVSPDVLQVDLLHGRGDGALDRAPERRDRYGNGRRLIFGERDLPAYYPEADGVHPAHRVPWLAVALRGSRSGSSLPRQDSWDDVAGRVVAQLRQVGAEEGTGPTASRIVRLRQALAPLTSYGLGVRPPQPAAALLQGAPACSRDAAAVALGQLGGLAAGRRLLLLTGALAPPFAESFPAAYPFRSAALALRLDEAWSDTLACEGAAWQRDYLCGAHVGDWVIYAPDCRSCAAGLLPPSYAGSRALAVDAQGRGRWVTVDAGEPNRHLRNTEARLVMDVAGNLSGTVDAELTGLPAARWRAAHFALGDATEPNGDGNGATDGDVAPGADNALAYRSIYGEGRAPRADGMVIKGLGDIDRGIFVHTQLSTSAKRTATDTFLLRPDDLVGESIPANWRAQRQESIVLPGPAWQDALALVTLPLGVEAEPLPPVKWVHPAAEYAAGFVQHGRTLKFSRRFVIKAGGLDVADWPDFADFVAKIRAYEASALRLRPAS